MACLDPLATLSSLAYCATDSACLLRTTSTCNQLVLLPGKCGSKIAALIGVLETDAHLPRSGSKIPPKRGRPTRYRVAEHIQELPQALPLLWALKLGLITCIPEKERLEKELWQWWRAAGSLHRSPCPEESTQPGSEGRVCCAETSHNPIYI